MNWWEAAILGLIQGLTEFLPVSSTGHLVLAQHFLGAGLSGESDVTFEVFVHLGTALSICTVYARHLRVLAAASLRAAMHPHKAMDQFRSDENLRMVWYVAVSAVPAACAYLLFADPIERAFADPRLACILLFVTGLLLLLTLLCRQASGPVTTSRALVTGIAQACAMLPGISRSGATICAALYQNVEPRRAADFSFLMLLPVVVGGALLKLGHLTGAPASWLPVGVGTLVAFIAGVAAIRVVLSVVKRGHLYLFAFYCFAVGIAGLLLL